MTQQEAESMANELGLKLNVLPNGFQFKRKNQIVTIYKHKWHYNMGIHGKQWKNFNGDHKQVLRKVFKKPQTATVDVNVLELSDKGVLACKRHIERKLKLYMDNHPGKVDNELCVMLKNLILEFEQYTYGDVSRSETKAPSMDASQYAYSIQQSAYDMLQGNAATEHGIAIEERAKECYQSYLSTEWPKVLAGNLPAMMLPYCQVGTLVSLNTAFLGQPIGTKCLVYDVDGRSSVALISEGGVEFGYFNEEEIVEHLEFLKHTQFTYTFKSVMQLMHDFRSGNFDIYFK